METIGSFMPFIGVAIVVFIILTATKVITFGPFDKGGKKPMTCGKQAASWQKRTASKLAKKAGKGALRSLKNLFS